MLDAHQLNLAVHIAAGSVGMGLGFAQLARTKGGDAHRRLGRWFVGAALVVTGTAVIGNILFRFLPLFAVLAVFVTYETVSGVRSARTRERGPEPFDLWWTVAGIGAAGALVPILLKTLTTSTSRPVVVWSTLGGLGVMLLYDGVRWSFPRRWFARLWEPEHIYKIVSSLFGMLSAFVGNVVRWGQPWSQILPSLIGVSVIGFFVVRSISLSQRAAARSGTDVAPTASNDRYTHPGSS